MDTMLARTKMRMKETAISLKVAEVPNDMSKEHSILEEARARTRMALAF